QAGRSGRRARPAVGCPPRAARPDARTRRRLVSWIRRMTADRRLDLLVAGELNPDIMIVDPDAQFAFGQVETLVDTIRLEIGSSSAITACGAARLGLRVGFVGVVGEDAFGRFMLDSLDAAGIDVSGCRIDPTVATGATVILTRGTDRANLTAIGAIDRLRADDI